MYLSRFIVPLAAVMLVASCSSDSTIEDEQVVDTQTPMVFGTSFSSSESVVTRSAVLESDFKVGTWKGFGTTGQQNVMDGYKVAYDATATPYKWNYVDVDGQVQRYWDLSAFPYDFRAVAPYLEGASFSSDGIILNLSATPFRAQNLINDEYNYQTDAAVQPCVVAHVTRTKDGTNYVDRDVIKNVEINTEGRANATREVHMPFHHLNSKIEFRIYIDDPQPTHHDYQVTIKNMEITAVKATGFISESQTYTATNAQGLSKGVFSDNTETDVFTLLKHGEYENVNFRDHLNKTDAYKLTPDYLQQIPQGNFKIRVQLEIDTYGVEDDDVDFTFDRLISLDRTNLEGDLFTWEPDYRYIYYLHIPNLHGHEIFLNTCEILPWDEVETTDIPIDSEN